MTLVRQVAFIGNYLPRRCGIATFTHDFHRAVSSARPDLETAVIAMTDSSATYDYPPAVHFEIHDEKIDSYVEAAEFLNNAQFDVVSLQHEYGIFGGPAGGNIMKLLSRLKMPVVTTLHTILAKPTPIQRDVMQRIIDISSKIVVMSKKGQQLMHSVHDVPTRKIQIIAHGIPDLPFRGTQHAKAKLGFTGKTVILTFGLLSPNKGIETMLDAMPEIIRSCPNAIYVILGATHPNLVRQQGEAYRDGLTARVCEIGIQEHVVFVNQFVEQAMLLDFISMCDVYTTPYLNEAQMTSGTLAYSFGLGKAVVSTPYWHAQELLSDGHGILVPFGDSKAIGAEIAGLLTNDNRRDAMRKRAYADSRWMTWPQTAKRYISIFETECARSQISHSIGQIASERKWRGIPDIQIGHFLSLCDSTGILQHAVHSVPDRTHGYCVDDNARALLLTSALATLGGEHLSATIIARFAAFIQHAWNPRTRRFRNFMSYERRWLEESGSEDSHGRTLWALAECARQDIDPSRRRWAAELFKTALPVVEGFLSPRAWAFTLLALDAYDKLGGEDDFVRRLRKQLADKLIFRFSETQTDDWLWFEDRLAYDNARLPQALIQTGLATRTQSYLDVGLRSLRWLMSIQTTPAGHFRPVGTMGFGHARQKPEAFDQQPVEASATISACLAASGADNSPEWPEGARRAFAWFLGENDLQTSLIDPSTGSCSDGLHPNRTNENKGAESVLSYLLGLVEIGQMKSAVAIARPEQFNLARSASTRSYASQTAAAGDLIVSIPISESPGLISPPRPRSGRRATIQAGDGTSGFQPDR
jgi:glycosyltransferase involved in cell wall biosynthesis